MYKDNFPEILTIQTKLQQIIIDTRNSNLFTENLTHQVSLRF